MMIKANYGKMEAMIKPPQMPRMDTPKIDNPGMAVKRPENKHPDGRPKAY